LPNFCQKGRGLGHVTPKILDIPSNISPKLIKGSDFIFGTQLHLVDSIGRANNFPEKGGCVSHKIAINFGAYMSKISQKPVKLETVNSSRNPGRMIPFNFLHSVIIS